MQPTDQGFHKIVKEAIGGFFDTDKYFKTNIENKLIDAEAIVEFYFKKIPAGDTSSEDNFVDKIGGMNKSLVQSLSKIKKEEAPLSTDENEQGKAIFFISDKEKESIKKDIALALLFMERIATQRELLKRGKEIQERENKIREELKEEKYQTEDTTELLKKLDEMKDERKNASPESIRNVEKHFWGMNETILKRIPKEVIREEYVEKFKKLKESETPFSAEDEVGELFKLERLSPQTAGIKNTKKDLKKIADDYTSNVLPEDIDEVMKSIFTTEIIINKSLANLEETIQKIEAIVEVTKEKEREIEREKKLAEDAKKQKELEEREAKKQKDNPPVPENEESQQYGDEQDEVVIQDADGNIVGEGSPQPQQQTQRESISWGIREVSEGKTEMFIKSSIEDKRIFGKSKAEVSSAGNTYVKELKKANSQLGTIEKSPSKFPSTQESPVKPNDPKETKETKETKEKHIDPNDTTIYQGKTFLAVEYEKREMFKKETHGDKESRGFDEEKKLWFVEPGGKREVFSKWEHDKQGIVLSEPETLEIEDAVRILEDKSGESFTIGNEHGGECRLTDSSGSDAGVVFSKMDSGSIRIHFFSAKLLACMDDGSSNIYRQEGKDTLFVNPDRTGAGSVVGKGNVFYKAREENDRLRRKEVEGEKAKEKNEFQDEVATKVVASLLKMGPAKEDHPYLVNKKVGAYRIKSTSFPDPDEKGKFMQTLVIPYQNIEGDVRTCQYIYPKQVDGTNKKIRYGGEKIGSFHIIGSDKIPAEGKVWLAEGYASGATVYEALLRDEKQKALLLSGEEVVIVGIDAKNMEKVAKKIKDKYPNIQMVVAGDNDKRTPEEQERGLVNSGVLSAKHIAKEQGAVYVLPLLRGELKKKAKEAGVKVSDFNDMVSLFDKKEDGLDAVKAILLANKKEGQVPKVDPTSEENTENQNQKKGRKGV